MLERVKYLFCCNIQNLKISIENMKYRPVYSSTLQYTFYSTIKIKWFIYSSIRCGVPGFVYFPSMYNKLSHPTGENFKLSGFHKWVVACGPIKDKHIDF